LNIKRLHNEYICQKFSLEPNEKSYLQNHLLHNHFIKMFLVETFEKYIFRIFFNFYFQENFSMHAVYVFIQCFSFYFNLYIFKQFYFGLKGSLIITQVIDTNLPVQEC
jgi:hypothetical protein